MNARCAVGHDTPWESATSATERAASPIAAPISVRNRPVVRARGGTCGIASVNVFRSQTPIAAAPESAPSTQVPGGASVYYPNCKAARAAGAAPLLVGQPGYRAGLDGDNDGVACE